MVGQGRCRRKFLRILLVATVGVPGMAELAAAQPPPSVVRPGAPGAPTRTLSAEDLRAPVRALHSEADVLFMQHMIVHHRQALVMSALVPERTEREDILYLARRIELSQDAEIAFMKRWLELRGEEAPGPDADHAHHGAPSDHADPAHGGHPAGHAGRAGPVMAGMLTAEQLEALANAEGPAFDRSFLELMILHHEGALEMVSELLASPGAARDSDIFDLAAHVYADQRMEIGRMRAMLQASP